ncbi:hypothetical protein BFG60_3026 [Microcystis aeruginosa NIES-98]|nr:hypothetical protein BFG60_3026 [Microcystis aeruginosa NIES-98]
MPSFDTMNFELPTVNLFQWFQNIAKFVKNPVASGEIY